MQGAISLSLKPRPNRNAKEGVEPTQLFKNMLSLFCAKFFFLGLTL